jgi:hypothetical protein
MFTDNINEFNDNFETPLMAATANGASEADLCLLVKVMFVIMSCAFFIF